MPEFNKSHKLVLSSIFISFFTFIFKMEYYPYRAQGDETVMVPDVQTILTQSHIYETNYHAGIITQIEFSILLQITDYAYWEGSQWISPLVGAIFYAVIISILYQIWTRETTNPIWYGFFLSIPPLYIFASQFNRFFLTSHKHYTIMLFIIMMYIVYIKIIQKDDYRITGILVLLLISLSLMNNIWGLLYGGVIGLPLMIHYLSDTRAHFPIFKSGFVISSIAVVFNWSLQDVQTIFAALENSIVILILEIFGTDIGQSGETISGVSSNWSHFHFYHFDFPVVYFWLIGVLIIIILSLLSHARILYRKFSKKTNYNYASMILGISLGFGALILIALSQSDIDTVRRMSPLPGIISILYVSIVLSDNQVSAKVDQSVLIKALIIVLIISSVLAVPRMAGNGKLNPYDGYVNEREISAGDFVGTYSPTSSNNIMLPTLVLKNAAIKKGFIERGTFIGVVSKDDTKKQKYNIIYSSGQKHKYNIHYRSINSSI